MLLLNWRNRLVIIGLLLLLVVVNEPNPVHGCRVTGERLKVHTRKVLEQLINADDLALFYWPNEPLETETLSRATGINITIAETRFSVRLKGSDRTNKIPVPSKSSLRSRTLLRDIFVSCTMARDRDYRLTMNLELTNPFQEVHFRFKPPPASRQPAQPGEANLHIRLPDSSFLVQLTQRVSRSECIEIKYAQLAPNTDYELRCPDCSDEQLDQLNKITSKLLSQLDAELDILLSDKLLLGLQALLSQQRIMLDLQ